jgi:hypothetical protein
MLLLNVTIIFIVRLLFPKLTLMIEIVPQQYVLMCLNCPHLPDTYHQRS